LSYDECISTVEHVVKIMVTRKMNFNCDPFEIYTALSKNISQVKHGKQYTSKINILKQNYSSVCVV